MGTSTFIRTCLSLQTLFSRTIPRTTAAFVMAGCLIADPVAAANLRVMKTGLGSGTITSVPAGIDCGGDCDESYPGTTTVDLMAMEDTGSDFLEWRGDCSGGGTCTVPMNAARSVRAVFVPVPAIPALSRSPDPSSGGLLAFTPEEIDSYLTANPSVNTAARFLAALPDDFKQNWILMSRSESLQTGTAQFPRLLLPSEDARAVFTLGLAQHSSYPGSHPDAIEYMQWDGTDRNFRFHEIVVDAIPMMDADGDGVGVIPARPRGVSIDDEKCHKCHSTRNVLNLDRSVTPAIPGSTAGTTGTEASVGVVKAKNKPNWDSYDSWGGMSPFNRDRIYQGSVEAAAFRKLLNPWTWRMNAPVRSVIEQLELQPPNVPPAHDDFISRLQGGANDSHIVFAFDTSPPVLTEPPPIGEDTLAITTSYSFDGVEGTGTATPVTRGGPYAMLRHSADFISSTVSVADEGRGVQLFDLLGGLDGNLNQSRIVDELIDHSYATGNFQIDVRPIAMAISKVPSCLMRNAATNRVESNPGVSPAPPALTTALDFFDDRLGMRINELFVDTRNRAYGQPRRKVDLQKLNLDRTGDFYLNESPPAAENANGQIQQYGAATSAGVDTSMTRIRQEIFRRPRDLGFDDRTVMGGIYVDREVAGNVEKVALYRYFLEPLGVSVDKWSMGVRGRSRTYTFADVFGTYTNLFVRELRASMLSDPFPGVADPDDCGQLITAINTTISSLPGPSSALNVPTYTDVQRIFNKSCVECHGGLDYPPYHNYGTDLDISEDEAPPAGNDRLDRSHAKVTSFYVTSDPGTSLLYRRITDYGSIIDPADPTGTVPYDPATANEDCPYGIMPCGGPPLNQADILTIRRWIVGFTPNTRGDPHIKTVDGVNYDFQAAGEFVLLRGQNFEIQARQRAVDTSSPLGPNGHTGLTSCVSVNSAIAVKVGRHRITYQPNLSGEPDPDGLQLRVDGELTQLGAQGVSLASGGRLVRTTAPGGIQIEAPGGSVVVITPGWWNHYQLWYMNVDARHVRATQGVMGAIPPGNWLPALPDGTLMGARPKDLQQRYQDLYETFGNAWRVNEATSLFDYAPGTSTDDFTVAIWPNGESPQSCIVPQVGRTPAPPARLPLQEAEQHCSAVVADDARANCVQDVAVTAEPGFAQTYLREEQVILNEIPTAPALGLPENFVTDLVAPIDFSWDRTADLDGDPLIYRYCVWGVNERYRYDDCDVLSTGTTVWSSGTACVLLVVLLGAVVLVVLLLVGVNRTRAILASVVVMILAAIILVYYFGCSLTASKTITQTVTELESGKAYYWKVIVEDGKGGTVESETRRFEMQ
jgi:mono/diheme cytochrome c family protein